MVNNNTNITINFKLNTVQLTPFIKNKYLRKLFFDQRNYNKGMFYTKKYLRKMSCLITKLRPSKNSKKKVHQVLVTYILDIFVVFYYLLKTIKMITLS